MPNSTADEEDEAGEPFIRVDQQLENALNTHDDEEVTYGREPLWCLYVSHFLSILRSEVYQACVIIFLQEAFPDDISFPTFISGLQLLCILLLAIPLGQWIDNSKSRLHPLIWATVVSSTVVVASCVLWPLVMIPSDDNKVFLPFTALVVLTAAERTSRMVHTLSIERDWIPILGGKQDPSHEVRKEGTSSPADDLIRLNAIMRGIEVVGVFLVPWATSAFVKAAGPTLAALLIAIVVSPCMAVEVWTIKAVWRPSLRLRAAKMQEQHPTEQDHPPRWQRKSYLSHTLSFCRSNASKLMQSNAEGLRFYFSTNVWLPSLCVVVTHGSVLAWSGGLASRLVDAGFSIQHIGLVKGVGYLFQLGSVFIFAAGVTFLTTKFGKRLRTGGESYQMVDQRDAEGDELHEHEDAAADDMSEVGAYEEQHKDATMSSKPGQVPGTVSLHAGTIDFSRWALTGFCVALVLTVVSLFCFDAMSVNRTSTESVTSSMSTLTAVLFFGFLTLSILGRWAFDLSVLQITQMLVPAPRRAVFGGAEQALIGLADLVRWIVTALWHYPSQLKWLALGSLCSIGVITVAYTWWVRGWMRKTV